MTRTVTTRRRTILDPVARAEAREKTWHVRQSLLETLTPEEWQRMDRYADRDHWQTCSLRELLAFVERARAHRTNAAHEIGRSEAQNSRDLQAP